MALNDTVTMNASAASPCCCCGQKTMLADAERAYCCPDCASLLQVLRRNPHLMRQLRSVQRASMEAAGGAQAEKNSNDSELPDVLEAKRYRTVDRDHNKWYLSVSEVQGRPVEIFASTAFDRDHELQSRISNLTTITRLISLILRHLALGEQLTFEKCLKQIQRSSRQKNDLPDMLYGVLSRYTGSAEERS